MSWINGKIYPNESGFYIARFKSGINRKAHFTLITTPKEDRKSIGKWGSHKPGTVNRIPFIDPIEWKNNDI